jgi:general secretion pathway protein C
MPSNIVRKAPWVSALCIGAAAHVGWIVHSCEPHAECPALEIPAIVAAQNVSQSPVHATRQLKCESSTECRITRAQLDALARSAPRSQARVVPHRRDGEIVGMKLYGVRPNSLLRHIGIRNGDLLRAIDGIGVTSLESAMQTWAHRHAPERLSLSLERKGKPVELVVVVVD